MYDFCLTYPYAAVLAFGGIIGFISKGSIPSLIGGLGSAAVLAACAQASLNAYHQGKLLKPATGASLVVAVGLSVMMGLRWRKTSKFMPAGIVALLSIAMVGFYVWNLVYIKEPLRRPIVHSK